MLSYPILCQDSQKKGASCHIAAIQKFLLVLLILHTLEKKILAHLSTFFEYQPMSGGGKSIKTFFPNLKLGSLILFILEIVYVQRI